MFDKVLFKTEAERQSEQEIQSVKNLVDHWLGLRMEREITNKENEKAFNDKIMKFASVNLRVTRTEDSQGCLTGEVTGISKKGRQGFKYQEILRR